MKKVLLLVPILLVGCPLPSTRVETTAKRTEVVQLQKDLEDAIANGASKAEIAELKSELKEANAELVALVEKGQGEADAQRKKFESALSTGNWPELIALVLGTLGAGFMGGKVHEKRSISKRLVKK